MSSVAEEPLLPQPQKALSSLLNLKGPWLPAALSTCLPEKQGPAPHPSRLSPNIPAHTVRAEEGRLELKSKSRRSREGRRFWRWRQAGGRSSFHQQPVIDLLSCLLIGQLKTLKSVLLICAAAETERIQCFTLEEPLIGFFLLLFYKLKPNVATFHECFAF